MSYELSIRFQHMATLWMNELQSILSSTALLSSLKAVASFMGPFRPIFTDSSISQHCHLFQWVSSSNDMPKAQYPQFSHSLFLERVWIWLDVTTPHLSFWWPIISIYNTFHVIQYFWWPSFTVQRSHLCIATGNTIVWIISALVSSDISLHFSIFSFITSLPSLCWDS